uniref:WRKY domain-containing protein n=1 Tax=Hordeum vulgare subsp. vulgare TaxID=112509 RepID=M0UGA7_HORVV
MQSQEKITPVKPVASRPFSSFTSFSKLLEDFTGTGSAQITSLGETVIVRRPKVTRFAPPPSDLSAGIAATMFQDAGLDTTREQMVIDPEQVVSCDQMTAFHNINKPIHSMKNRLSYDGYNWRKYGQKQVKGSEFPRSYYKCTHPTCPVKRKVETTVDGQIAEIVYNGEHNHPQPHPPKKPTSSASTEVLVPGAHGSNDAGAESQVGGCNLVLGSAPVATAFRSSCDCVDEFGNTSPVYHCNTSRKEKQSSITNGLTSSSEAAPAFQSPTECESSRDAAFRWRKYGQKAVNGNSFPRSYYRCSTARCNARKFVERSSDNSLVTTYEGKHNHAQLK